MAYYRYMVDRKLRNSETEDYKRRVPPCGVCGLQLMRVAVREPFHPYAWLPSGWWCVGCCILDLEDSK